MRKLMKVKKPGTRPSWTTRDHFVACIPWNENSAVLVHQRERGRRFYVRFRTWNRHQTKGVWYPTKRGFIIPLQRAEALAESLVDAVKGRMSEKPEWLLDWEEEERTRRALRLGDALDSPIPLLDAPFNSPRG